MRKAKQGNVRLSNRPGHISHGEHVIDCYWTQDIRAAVVQSHALSNSRGKPYSSLTRSPRGGSQRMTAPPPPLTSGQVYVAPAWTTANIHSGLCPNYIPDRVSPMAGYCKG